MKKLIGTLLLAGSSLFAGPRVFVGVGVGIPVAPPPPPVYYATPAPGLGYTWVNGYYYYVGPRRMWRAGYWAAPRHYYGRPYVRGYRR